VVLAVLAAFALIQRQTAIQQRQTAITRELLANSAALTAKDPGDSMLLAVEAFHYQPTVETRSALLSSQGQYFAGQLTGLDAVFGVAFSPDGRTLATANVDHNVKLWDVASHQLIATLTGHTNNVNGLAFSPDGHTLATGSADHTIRLWDLDTTRGTDQLCHIIGAPSRADWARLIPDLPYRPTCPGGAV
jgi:WD40 repeat protein